MKNSHFPKLFILTVLLLLVVQVLVSNRLSTTGERITKIDEEIEKIEEENDSLEKEIASSSSLLILRERASLLGFQKTALTFNLFEKLPVAKVNP